MILCDHWGAWPRWRASVSVPNLEPYSAVLVKNGLRLGKANVRIEKLKCRLKNQNKDASFPRSFR